MFSLKAVYYLIVLICISQRLAELHISRKNQGALRARGYHQAEATQSLRAMIALHVLWFVGLLLEPLLIEREINPLLFYGGVSVFFIAQLLRYAALKALGVRWNVSVMAPSSGKTGIGLVTDRGPYRFIRHPNYLAVILEIASLPLAGGAYLTALICSILNGLILSKRIEREEKELFKDPIYNETMRSKGRLFPLSLRG